MLESPAESGAASWHAELRSEAGVSVRLPFSLHGRVVFATRSHYICRAAKTALESYKYPLEFQPSFVADVMAGFDLDQGDQGRYADQCKPRGRKPKAKAKPKAKCKATNAEPKAKCKATKAEPEAKCKATKAERKAKGKAKAKPSKKTESEEFSEGPQEAPSNTIGDDDASPKLEGNKVPQAEPKAEESKKRKAADVEPAAELSKTLSALCADASASLPPVDELGEVYAPPAWVSGNNVYTAVYKTFLARSTDSEQARARSRLATRIFKHYGVLPRELMGTDQFKAEGRKKKANKAASSEPPCNDGAARDETAGDGAARASEQAVVAEAEAAM